MSVYRRLLIPVYFIVCAVVYGYSAGYADNPDTFQYLNIARKYAEGVFSVNGYWSPLISWLLILPLKVTANGILSFKLLQVITGAIALLQWQKLVARFRFYQQDLITFFALPFVVVYALLNLTPDLLFLTIALWLFNLSFDETPARATKVAIAGALLYFTKAFGLPFFIAWLIAEAILFKRPSRVVLKSAGIFSVLTLPWIFALSVHYEKPMISLAGKFNTSIDVSPLPGRAAELPVLRGGIIDPLPGTLSAWETPGEFVSSRQITLWSDANDYGQVVMRNLKTIWFYDFQRQLGLIFLLLMLHSAIFNRSVFYRREIQLSIIMLVLVYGGYSLILVHTRYVWICYWMMFLLTMAMVQNMKSIGKDLKLGVVLLFLVFAWKRPIKQIFFTEDKDISFFLLTMSLRNPLTTMEITYRPDRDFEKSLKKIENYSLTGKLIAIKSDDMSRSIYAKGLRIAFDHRLTFCGTIDAESKIPDKGNYLIYSESKSDTLLQVTSDK